MLARFFQIDVEIVNTGQDLQMKFLDSTTIIIFSAGPLVYDYKLFGAIIKFGSRSSRGSDHQIDGIAFPAEVEILTLLDKIFNCV